MTGPVTQQAPSRSTATVYEGEALPDRLRTETGGAAESSAAHGRPAVIAVLGPTAVGKSDLAVALARAVGGEIVNADSMQLYRGMDIGTAKLTEAERQGVPHHLLDIWQVTERAAVAEYQRLARVTLDRLLAEGKPAILVGGSGLYVHATLDDFEFPGTDPELRAELEAQLAELGAGAMHARLAAADPGAAAAILPSNGRRIVRALEVIELTGGRFTATLPGHSPHYPHTLRLGLTADRAVLDERITRRVDVMWERGLVDEVRVLERIGLREGATASRALGYKQVLAFLAGECSEQEARELTVKETKRFARRQESWFRRDPHVHWLDQGVAGLYQAALELVRG
nr:tRNA (adenosine(37)-N6)-dimethylallyltransferase MiaA [Actinocrinis puniceicyclus]